MSQVFVSDFHVFFKISEDLRRNMFSFSIMVFRFAIAIQCLTTTFLIQGLTFSRLYIIIQNIVQQTYFSLATRSHLGIFLLLVFIVKYFSFRSGTHCMHVLYCIAKKAQADANSHQAVKAISASRKIIKVLRVLEQQIIFYFIISIF